MTTVVIVGAGPRGLAVLERIAAHVSAGDPLADGGVIVHLVDPHPPGGQVWRAAQPNELLMNTIAADATLYLDDTVRAEGPPFAGPTLLEWLDDTVGRDPAGRIDPALASELRQLTPTTSLSRRLYGTYLAWVFDEVAGRLRAHGAQLHTHAARAAAIEPNPRGERVLLTDGTSIDADAVVLALGHDRNAPTAAERAAQADAEAGDWIHLGPANPVDQDWDRLPPGADVVVRGLGLNFFDTMALVTLGRGGAFHRDDDGTLRYRPSGREPVLWAGSRRGVPFKAKPRMLWPRRPQQRRYPSDATLAGFDVGPFDFDRDGWPWVRKEALFQYYLAQAGAAQAGADELGRLAAVFDAAPGSAVPTTAQLRTAFPGFAHEFDPDRTGDPFSGVVFASQPEAEAAILAWIEHDLAEAAAGPDSAIKAGDAAIGASRGWLSPLSDFGGFAPGSHRRYQGWFSSYANSLAGGPPAIRNEQLLALARAGIVRFLPPGMVVSTDPDGVLVQSAAVPGWSLAARALVEARIHGPSIRESTNPLIRSLADAGRIRAFVVPGEPAHDTDGLDVTPAPFRLIDRDGRVNERIFALGVPLGVQIGTSFTAFARSNSPFLREADGVARAALALGGVTALPENLPEHHTEHHTALSS